ncbi:hypothetical protein N7516_008722 [Penicillium verrucosum]|uniref:uncharacterized protein n=1 Tax=Penicillium verrucosum TaxID=60171 RepID=UPI0025452D5C|nr:uncharacterized protein N7516_008722 [Penicillium verrucosum]KAJ5926949.1 hypothetical protein N7516_008722 [Penicillium verrucosum]
MFLRVQRANHVDSWSLPAPRIIYCPLSQELACCRRNGDMVSPLNTQVAASVPWSLPAPGRSFIVPSPRSWRVVDGGMAAASVPYIASPWEMIFLFGFISQGLAHVSAGRWRLPTSSTQSPG